MIDTKSVLTILSVVCVLAASPPYIVDTIRGRTKPERATWAIFTVLGLIAIVSQLAAGATWSVVFTVVDSLAGALIFVLSIWFGIAGWSAQDRIALMFAGVGVVLAVVARNPLFSVLGVVVADGSGMALTLKKAFLDPGNETSVSWGLTAVGSLCAVFTVNQVTLAQLLYPIYLDVANGGVVVAQYLGYAYKKRRV